MIRFAICAALAFPFAAEAQEAMPLESLLPETHIHGIAGAGADSITLATHNGLFAVDLASLTAVPIGESRNDFMGFSTVPRTPGLAFASGHPMTGGNLGIIRSEDGGKTWQRVAEGIDGPVDFHNMEVSRADPATIYGISHDGNVQQSKDAGQTWVISGLAPDKLIDIATSASDPARLYAATETGLFRSSDAGATWKPLLDTAAPVSTVDVGQDGLLRAFQLGRGLIVADETLPDMVFQTIGTELTEGYLLYLAQISQAEGRLAALSDRGAIVFSDDGGSTWRSIAGN